MMHYQSITGMPGSDGQGNGHMKDSGPLLFKQKDSNLLQSSRWHPRWSDHESGLKIIRYLLSEFSGTKPQLLTLNPPPRSLSSWYLFTSEILTSVSYSLNIAMYPSNSFIPYFSTTLSSLRCHLLTSSISQSLLYTCKSIHTHLHFLSSEDVVSIFPRV